MPSPYDAVIIGAGTAGLSAAVLLGRSRRRVLVLDGGPPRNAPAPAAHNVFTRDGTPPLDLLRMARADLAAYPNAEVREGRAVGVEGAEEAFVVALDDGAEVAARQVVLATGVVDELPEWPGVRELWGGTVFHCPYCHGWEVRERPLAVAMNGPDAADRVVLLRAWSDDVVLLTDGPSEVGAEGQATLDALGAETVEAPVAELVGDGDQLRAVRFADGTEVERGGLLLSPPQREASGLAAALGCETTETGHVAATMGRTSVPGVWAAGDLTTPLQSVASAAAQGSTAGAMLNHALAHADAEDQTHRPGVR
ncbi:NAD(P)/FAD-dependent oxidoreductase [Rubrivirga sp.]|uniref:NAD(P)/FAD-dependent oxidoreductase n=1 Tax=Rubrivirga sp. TaxID=1885344 RepID=UPI003B5275EF